MQIQVKITQVIFGEKLIKKKIIFGKEKLRKQNFTKIILVR